MLLLPTTPRSPIYLKPHNYRALRQCSNNNNNYNSTTSDVINQAQQQSNNNLDQILWKVARGELDPSEATFLIQQENEQFLEQVNFDNSNKQGYIEVEQYAKLDHMRAERTGECEVVWGPGKTPTQIANIMSNLSNVQKQVVATRIEPQTYAEVRAQLPGVEYNALGKILKYENPNAQNAVKVRRVPGSICIATAGTADLAVAEECRIICDTLGVYAYKIADIGVAGIHRLFGSLQSIRSADVVICVAGMDAALPSVLAGLIQAPLIAVPTSVGYGAAFQGLAPLLSTLNSCAPGVTVVNIDNGFGAAVAAARILRTVESINQTRQRQSLQMQGFQGQQPDFV